MFRSVARVNYHTCWITAECDGEILDYYWWWWWKAKHVKLMKPMFGAHISIVRGKEEEIEEGWWECGLRGKVEFCYHPERLFLYDTHVWLPVSGEGLNNIRESVGLLRNPVMPFHMTIGRVR